MKLNDFLRPGRCFVIAEAGVNHNRDVRLAKRLVDAAREAGADAVKFQTWITEDVMTRNAPLAAYQRENLGADHGQFAMAKNLELSFDEFREISDYARDAGILFFSTPDEEKSADFLESLGMPIFKVGSAEVTNLPFVRYIAAKGKPLILSTGMATLGEVEAAVKTVESTGNRELALLHCVSSYPTEPAECNLRAIGTLATAFGYPVGFSDHTLGTNIAMAAVMCGARVIEKHITLDKSMEGPDHRASLSPEEFTAMVAGIRTAESALGDGVKRPMPSEADARSMARRSIVASRRLEAGAVLTRADLAVKRPAGGLVPKHLDDVIGRKLKRSVEPDEFVVWADLDA